MRKYEAVIPENQPDGKISLYLQHAFPLLPEHVIRDALKKRDVKVDGGRVSSDAWITRGAKVELFTAFEAQLPIVYEDEHVIVIDKPSGLSADDDLRGGMTVQTLLNDYAAGAFVPRSVHRLDNKTCGLMILAKDDESEQCLLGAFKERLLDKRYTCVVRGTMRPKEDIREAYLVKDAREARVRIVTHQTPEAKPIKTGYRVLTEDGTTSRLEITLYTGRTHQIRAHMAFLAHPLVGDDVYGDRNFNRQMKTTRLMLCSSSMTLNAGGVLSYLDGKTFTANVPF